MEGGVVAGFAAAISDVASDLGFDPAIEWDFHGAEVAVEQVERFASRASTKRFEASKGFEASLSVLSDLGGGFGDFGGFGDLGGFGGGFGGGLHPPLILMAAMGILLESYW